MKKMLILLLAFISILFGNSNLYAYGFGYKKNNVHNQPEIGKYSNELIDTNSYYVGNKNEKILYLTFDAGYDNGVLSKILDVLKEKEVKATFFVTGDFLRSQKELLLRIVNEGHIVGNHTYGHKDITKLSYDELDKEISDLENEYKDITGLEMEHYFRPPEGSFNKQALLNVKKRGYQTFFWSIAYVDWKTDNQHGEEYGYNNIMNNLHNGAIILMHTVSTDNLKCLPRVIDDARKEGYSFKNLNEFSA